MRNWVSKPAILIFRLEDLSYDKHHTNLTLVDREDIELYASFCLMWIGLVITEIVTINQVKNNKIVVPQ